MRDHGHARLSGGGDHRVIFLGQAEQANVLGLMSMLDKPSCEDGWQVLID